jgi:fatty acid desaturase
LGTLWAVPAFFVYGTLYAGPADSRWHEAGHGTPFKTRWMNEWLYQLASFQVMRRPTVWRWSHARHHSDTLITGRDQEIQVQLPVQPLAVLADFVGLKLAPHEFAKAIANAFGHSFAEELSFLPASEVRKTRREAAAWVAIYATVGGTCLYWQTLAPLLFIGLPSVYGAWLYNFFGITQHAALPENVLDHRLNSRTVMMNPAFRFLYWNMNYHLEHHMYPLVPYHALPKLHAAVKSDCPPPYPSTWSAYREVLPALLRQWRDPTYHVKRPLPQSQTV